MVSGLTSVATLRVRYIRASARAPPDDGVAYRSIVVGVRTVVLSACDFPREETRSHPVARGRAIRAAPRAASVTESRRESTRVCRPSFQTLRGQLEYRVNQDPAWAMARKSWLRRYVQGLLSDSSRKSMHAMLARVTEPETYHAFQHFKIHRTGVTVSGVAVMCSGRSHSRRYRLSRTARKHTRVAERV
jgi:hypothetical protein